MEGLLVTIALIQLLAVIPLAVLLVRAIGNLHSELADIIEEVKSIETTKCNFYPQEMPTIKEIHQVVEKVDKNDFIKGQHERVRLKYNIKQDSNDSQV